MNDSYHSIRKTAHDLGDPQIVSHCAFCGSGQVIGRSDRSIECEFCHVVFTVRVQPMYPSFPQSINGVPIPVPGMPDYAQQQGGQMPGQPPVDPSQVDDQGNLNPDMDPSGQENDQDVDDAEDGGGEDQPPWQKKSYRTATGASLPLEEYERHLAIRHAQDQDQMRRTVRDSRR